MRMTTSWGVRTGGRPADQGCRKEYKPYIRGTVQRDQLRRNDVPRRREGEGWERSATMRKIEILKRVSMKRGPPGKEKNSPKPANWRIGSMH